MYLIIVFKTLDNLILSTPHEVHNPKPYLKLFRLLLSEYVNYFSQEISE